VDDEIDHFQGCAHLQSVDYSPVSEKGAIGVAEFEGNHAGGIAAQKPPGLGAHFTSHVRCKRALAAAEGSLVEAHVTLPTDKGKLYSIEDRGFAGAIDANKIGAAFAIDGGIFKQCQLIRRIR
jgi:hypothetical protein